jgi:Holliday junction DNA helicase RuvA
MIYSVNGIITLKSTDMIVIECGGVGYGCRTSLNTLSKSGAIGDTGKLVTHLHVTETGIELFGFAEESELSCFKLLLSVSGVGPKAALSVLSTLTPERFALSVAGEDISAFRGIKGVGAKTASRIVLELKDKLKKQVGDMGDIGISLPNTSGIGNSGKTTAASEAVAALIVLGFSQAEAVHAVAGLSAELSASDLSAPDMIKSALKTLSSAVR